MVEVAYPISLETDDIYSMMVKDHLNERVLILNSEIDDSIFEYITLNIIKWNKEDKDIPVSKRKPIYIYINSCGGEVAMGNQILSSITTSKTPVITVGFGHCDSMAIYILVAGHKRYCFPHTVVLCHDGTMGYMTSGNKGKDIQKYYDEIDSRLNGFLIEHTKMTPEFMDEIKDREYYMFAPEAKERGIVDKIIGVDCELDEIL